jgi:spore germination protein Q
MEMMNNPYKVGNQGQVNPYGYPAAAAGYPGYPGGFGGVPGGMPGGAQQMTPPPVASGGTISGPMSIPQATASAGPNIPGLLPVEQSYIENILRLNLGKIATIYMTFENNKEWNAKVFKGRLEAAGRDHIIISDPQTGMRYLLLMVNLDYVTFDEELKYSYSFGGGAQGPGAGGGGGGR